MRFALLGDHVDGLDAARALTASGRHELTIYSGPAAGLDSLRRWGLQPAAVGDLEEVLANPAVEAVIVAGSKSARAGQLRRALQSERHVLCVHPAGDSADLAYEAAMLQAEVRCVLLPLLAESLHPGIRRLADLAHACNLATAITADPSRPPRTVEVRPLPGEVKLLEIERWSTEEVLLQDADRGHASRPGHSILAGWDTLRLLGGEVAEVYVLAEEEEPGPSSVVLMSGQFVGGGLFQQTLLPCQAENRLRFALVTMSGRAELTFPQGYPGPAELSFRDADGVLHSESWPALDPWPALVERFEMEVARLAEAKPSGPEVLSSPARLSWQDEIRALELDAAAHRSLHRRRSATLEYQPDVEEASFKGAMTLLGCGVMLIALLLLVFSAFAPWLRWLILPAFGIFLLMQLLRLVVRPGEKQRRPDSPDKPEK